MRFSIFTDLVGTTAANFKALTRRGHSPLLPILINDADEEAADSKRRQYTFGEALKLKIALKLMEAGMPQASAGLFVRRGLDLARQIYRQRMQYKLPNDDIWFGAAYVPVENTSLTAYPNNATPVAGVLSDLRLSRGFGSKEQWLTRAEFEPLIDGIVIVNVSKTTRELLIRARELQAQQIIDPDEELGEDHLAWL